MTNQEAKGDCLKIWGYLRDNSEIEYKEDLPQELYDLIKYLRGNCPLCEVFMQCSECPLSKGGERCSKRGSAYACWCHSTFGPGGDAKRREAAGRIYDIIEAWEV
jgi:hypothetical protein